MAFFLHKRLYWEQREKRAFKRDFGSIIQNGKKVCTRNIIQLYKMAFEQKKKVRKNSVENSFQAQNKTAKFLSMVFKGRAVAHARHITYKSIIQLASQKKFWHKHGMKKKTFSFSRTDLEVFKQQERTIFM